MTGRVYRGRRVLVTGAAGFIGLWVARALSRAGADLVLSVRDARTARPLLERYEITGEIVENDLRDVSPVGRLVREVAADTTFSLAGYGVDPGERSADLAHQLNVTLVENLATAADRGTRLVHVGSAAEYGAAGGDLVEDTPPRPTTLYGRTKLAGTLALSRVCRERGVNGVTARLFTVYGPGEHAGRLFPSLCEAARIGAPLDLTSGEQRRDFTYVEDVADGLLRLGLSDARPGEIVNLATGTLTAVRAFAEEAARALRIPPARLHFGAMPSRPEEMSHEPVNVSRMRQLLDWAPPTGVTAGVRATLAFDGLARHGVAGYVARHSVAGAH